MQIGVAHARRRFREVLEAVDAGERVEITRRGVVVAVVMSPSRDPESNGSLGADIETWRASWEVDSWPDDDVFERVREPSPGRSAPW